MGVFSVVVWGLSQRLRPSPMPPSLAFLLDSRLVDAVVGSELLVERAGIRYGMRVLDAGSGPGRVTLALSREVGRTGRVLALDVQEPMLHRLRSRLEAEKATNVATLRAELGTGELAEGESFDRVIMSMAIGEIRLRTEAYEELYRALVPGGIFSITETLEPDYRRRATVREEIEASGFLLDRVYGGIVSYTMNFKKP